MKEFIANGLWWASCWRDSARFDRSTRQVEKTQRRRLAEIVKKNQATRFGREHGFGDIRSVEDYQDRVPLMKESLLTSCVEEIADGRRDVLFPGLPLCLEPTSGSTGGSKLIPYSSALRKEFQSGIAVWVADLFRHYPGLLFGSAYWSLSPSGHLDKWTEGGVRVGFLEDTEYLNPLLRELLGWVLAIPSEVARINDRDGFRYVTLTFLLKAGNLSLISVWNPSFLSLLFGRMKEWFPRLTEDIRRGVLRPPFPVPSGLVELLNRRMKGPDPARAAELEKAFLGGADGWISRVWPRLRVISCWADGAAQGPAESLKGLVPKIAVLPKGLMATEAIVSVPKIGYPGAALAVRSHFFEFVPEAGEGRPATAWMVEEGRRYSVVLTTGGGLYRYPLNDVVEVSGMYNECPLLTFVGKKDKVSDVRGEKLHESHVAEALSGLFNGEEQKPSFALLAPEAEGERVGYILFLSGNNKPPPEKIARWQDGLERALRKNIHYDYCRRLGQLEELGVFWVEDRDPPASELYLKFFERLGRKAGGVKPVFLDSRPGWKSIFLNGGNPP